MFGKNYDKEIDAITKQLNSNTNSIIYLVKEFNNLNEKHSEILDHLVKITAIQAQHKTMLSFLINHATVDSDAKEDVSKMMQEVIKLEKLAKSK